MTDGERIALRDYIDARLAPIEGAQVRIERKVDGLAQNVDNTQSAEDRELGAKQMRLTIWRAAAATIAAMGGLIGIVVAISDHI